MNIARVLPRSVIVYDPRFLDHVPSPFHVERADRLRAILDRLEEEHLLDAVDRPVPATQAEILRVHRKAYVDSVETLEEGLIDPETAVHPQTFEIARLAAGAVEQATRNAVRDNAPAIALVRPPGHHAGPDYGGGFCYLNNVAIAAADQASAGRRVAILDYDGHHGNGTRDIFAEDPDVLYLSTHQYGIYPGTGPAEDVGSGEGRGFTVNLPFRAGCGDASYSAAQESIIGPIVEAFHPDVILMSLGVDSHYRDPLTSLTLSSPGYIDLVDRAIDLAKRLCSRRLAIALEGGYHLDAVSEVLAGVVGRLRGRSIEMALTEVLDSEGRGRDAIDATRRAQSAYWNLR